MIENIVNQYISNEALFAPTHRILVAVSGGVDSMVMLHLLHRSGYQLGVAHCNFKLRGTESDQDEKFVSEAAHALNLPFHSNTFETAAYARQQRISIQMAARHLRYTWFESLTKSFNYQSVAVGHNSDDAIETFFINFLRGSGIRGLTGISPKSGQVVRPLLCISRSEIETYALSHGINFRTDSSNATTKYARNRIRLQILPLFEEINPAFRKSARTSLMALKDAQEVVTAHLNKTRKELIAHSGWPIVLKKKDLIAHQPLAFYLYELLCPYGFNASQISDIIGQFDLQAGATFHTPEYTLLTDRNQLLLYPTEEGDEHEYLLHGKEESLKIKAGLRIKKITLKTQPITPDFTIPAKRSVACVDYDKLHFPLIFRRWRAGDWFYPLGMEHSKKLSDFFVDVKLSRYQKEHTWVLCSGKDIIWVVGLRIDNRFKITKETKTACFLSFTERSCENKQNKGQPIP